MGTRLSHADRTRSIVAAATSVFSEMGFELATTKQIAKVAKVSPALLYEHFPSKERLYRAVLRKLIRDQDAFVATFSIPSLQEREKAEGAAALVAMLHGYYTACVNASEQKYDVTAHRLLLASLVGDATYARLLYRRALRNSVQGLHDALADARAMRQLTGEPLSAPTAFCFIEHVGSMMISSHLAGRSVAPYSEAGQALVRQAVFFSGRGLGLPDAVIAEGLDPLSRLPALALHGN